MVLQTGNMGGKPLVSIWLSKDENNDMILQDVIDILKKKYKVCTYRSGQTKREEVYKKIVVDAAAHK